MEAHIKRAQLLTLISMVVFVIMFIIMYMMLSGQIDKLENKVGRVGSDLKILDSVASENFEEISDNIESIEDSLGENAKNINQTNLLLEDLGGEIIRVGEESQQGIRGIKSDLNYTGTIDIALDSVVLVIWTDKESIVGSGFFVSSDGYIMTANHVVENFDGKTVRVKDRSGEIYVASIEETDEDADVAVLKIQDNDTPYLEFGDSETLSSGSKVFALGSPEGFPFSATEGIVSAVRSVRSIKDEVGLTLDLVSNIKVVQTDAAITHGNSGGPLINNHGEVVGLNSFGVSRATGEEYQDVEGLNFAISANDVKRVYDKVF